MSGTPFKMKGHSLPGPNQASNSPLRQEEIENVLEDSGVNQLRKQKKGRISTRKQRHGKDKKLPTFRKGDISISQYDKKGNKRYNLVDE